LRFVFIIKVLLLPILDYNKKDYNLFLKIYFIQQEHKLTKSDFLRR